MLENAAVAFVGLKRKRGRIAVSRQTAAAANFEQNYITKFLNFYSVPDISQLGEILFSNFVFSDESFPTRKNFRNNKI